MFRYILILLLPMLCLGQPVPRYFDIPLPNQEIAIDAIVVKGNRDTVEVFYKNTTNFLRHFTFSLASGEMIGNAINLHPVPNSSNTLLCAQVLADGSWVSVTRSANETDSGTVYHGWLVQGMLSSSTDSYHVYESLETGGFASGGTIGDCRISAGPDSGFVMTAIGRGRWGIEPTATLVFFFDVPYVPDFQIMEGHNIFAFPCFWHSDTLDILTYLNVGQNVMARLPTMCDTFDCQALEVEWGGPYPEFLLTTPSGRWIGVSNENLFEINHEGEDSIITVLSLDHYYNVMDAQPAFGFAFMEDGQLIRIDTNGVIVHPEEYVEWPLEYSRLQLNSLGESVASGVVENGNARVAIVPWEAPLDSPEPIAPIAHSYSLSAFPNPFNSEVRIEYSITQPQEIELTVFNSLGQEVETLVNEHSTVGTHSVSWSPTTGSGIYFVKLTSTHFNQTTKLLYIR